MGISPQPGIPVATQTFTVQNTSGSRKVISNLSNTIPTSIGRTRELCHLAIQWPSCAALAHQADDSHSNLGRMKEHSALVSWLLDADEQYQPGFCFVDPSLLWLVAGQIQHRLELAASSEELVGVWVDERLTGVGLQTASEMALPYVLVPLHYEGFSTQAESSTSLGFWFAAETGDLPEAVAPTFWHRDGFLSLVAPASHLKDSDMQVLLPTMMEAAHSAF